MLRALQLEDDPEIQNALLREALAISLHDPLRPANERPSGLRKEERLFRLESPLLLAVAGHPQFAPDLRVMIDLDSTLFPLDGALREMGVHFRTRNSQYWESGESDLSDAILLDRFGRNDLCGKDLSEEQRAERITLITAFFAELHSSAERLRSSGVFEYAPDMLRMLQQNGAEIHIFTHRDERSTKATLDWLRAMGIPYDKFRLEDPSRDSSRSDKIAYCLEEGISICVDDKPDTIRQAEAAAIEALSLSWPYTEAAIKESGADPARCWRELGEGIIRHMELAVMERALREELPLPESVLREAMELGDAERPLRSQRQQ
jgi:phosphoglycolate phosphatase-like HAD superfamily hydrolase